MIRCKFQATFEAIRRNCHQALKGWRCSKTSISQEQGISGKTQGLQCGLKGHLYPFVTLTHHHSTGQHHGLAFMGDSSHKNGHSYKIQNWTLVSKIQDQTLLFKIKTWILAPKIKNLTLESKIQNGTLVSEIKNGTLVSDLKNWTLVFNIQNQKLVFKIKNQTLAFKVKNCTLVS